MSEPEEYGKVIDDEDGKLVASLVGRTIVKARWFDESPGDSWTGHEKCWLYLDDGRVIEFGGWGHDAWGATVEQVHPIPEAQPFTFESGYTGASGET
ncbi:MAG: hypothetical protein AB7U76_26325 [Pirellulales bacterium]